MKIKKVQILRPEFEVESDRPFLAKLYIALWFPRLIKVVRSKVYCEVKGYGGYSGRVHIKKVWFIAIPKIRVVDSA